MATSTSLIGQLPQGRLTRLTPMQGFYAEPGSHIILFLATGHPVSLPHDHRAIVRFSEAAIARGIPEIAHRRRLAECLLWSKP